MSEISNVSNQSNNISGIIGEVCTKHAKALGGNNNSIFTSLVETCQNFSEKDFTLGKMYSTFCKTIKNFVTKITTALARFAYDLATSLVNFFKNNGTKVSNKREALVDSVKAMADSTYSCIPITGSRTRKGKGNGLGYDFFRGGNRNAWCADTVRTFYLGIPELSEELGEDFKNICNVDGFIAWGNKNNIYTKTRAMKNSQKAEYIINNVKPGDIMIHKSNGASHAAIVVEVYPEGFTDSKGIKHPKGSFLTVDGNTSTGLDYRINEPGDKELSGFIDMSKYLDNE